MPEFRVPNMAQAIGEAVQAAVDPNRPNSTLDHVTQLVHENYRSIEDAIDRGGVTGSQFLEEFPAADDQVEQLYDWTMPAVSGLYLAVFSLVGDNMTSGYTVEINCNDNRWSVEAIDSTVTTAVTGMVLATHGETLEFKAMWRGVDSTRDLTLWGGAIKIT